MQSVMGLLAPYGARLKTWLRSTMNHNRLNWCMVLHVHITETDLLDIKHIGNEFISRNSSRQHIFGRFVNTHSVEVMNIDYAPTF